MTIEGVKKAIQGEIQKKIGIDNNLNPIVTGFNNDETPLIQLCIKAYIDNSKNHIWL